MEKFYQQNQMQHQEHRGVVNYLGEKIQALETQMAYFMGQGTGYDLPQGGGGGDLG